MCVCDLVDFHFTFAFDSSNERVFVGLVFFCCGFLVVFFFVFFSSFWVEGSLAFWGVICGCSWQFRKIFGDFCYCTVTLPQRVGIYLLDSTFLFQGLGFCRVFSLAGSQSAGILGRSMAAL